MNIISEKGRKMLRMVYRCLWVVAAFFIFKSCTTKPILIDDMIVPEYGPPLAVENQVDAEDAEANESVDAE